VVCQGVRQVYVVQQVARNVLAKWKEAGAEGDPNELRKLFLKQSLVPISATLVQVCSLSARTH
jgi:hypothetical protein